MPDGTAHDSIISRCRNLGGLGVRALFACSMSAVATPTIALVLTTVACTMSYALVFPTLAPLLAHLDGNTTASGTSRWLGVAVAIFSATKVVAAPLVGMLTMRIGWRPTLAGLLLLLLAGNAWYAIASAVASVISARGLIGIASCSSTICRTAALQARSKEARERNIALISSASTFGFIAGPGIGGGGTQAGR